MMRVVRTGLIVIAAQAGSPALAQGMPANPFASNYPSEPPQVRRERPYGSVRRRPSVRRGAATPRVADRLRPPASIPGGRPGR